MGGVVTGVEPASGRREERKAQNRAKLLGAARKVFAEKGLGEATARDIVRETDLATGTFYNYFTDKDHCFRVLLEEAADRSAAAVRARRNQPGLPLEDRVAEAYRAYFEWAVSERELFEVFRRNAGAIAVTSADIFAPGIRELFDDLTDWADAGEIPHVDLDYLASATAGAAFQVGSQLVDRDPPDVEEATSFCTRMFLGGVQALGDGG